MSGFSTIRIEGDARGVATLTLARPERHNAMDAAMIGELARAAVALGEDVSVRAVVLTGEGKSFSAGADLNWMKAQFDASRAERIAEATALARMLKALNEMPKPLIGRINGQAFGGGLGLISVCDVAVASQSARFAFTEVKLGLIPATISPFVAARMGEARARRVFMSGRMFDAQEAGSGSSGKQSPPMSSTRRWKRKSSRISNAWRLRLPGRKRSCARSGRSSTRRWWRARRARSPTPGKPRRRGRASRLFWSGAAGDGQRQRAGDRPAKRRGVRRVRGVR